MLVGDALDVFGGDVEKVRGDGSVAAGEHQAGTLDALLDGVGVREWAGRRVRLRAAGLSAAIRHAEG
jgi:hypothetical protein